MNNQNKNQNQDRKSSPGSDDNRNRDKHGSQRSQGSPQHTGAAASGSKTAGSDQNRNPQR